MHRRVTASTGINHGWHMPFAFKLQEEVHMNGLHRSSGILHVIRMLSLLALAFAALGNPAPAAAASVLHVEPGGTGDCSDWGATACELQDALTAASSGDQIWVKAGTYKPDIASPNDRSLSFTLISGVEVYGGFAGGETALSQRDPVANVTILSGDINVSPNRFDNSCHVDPGRRGRQHGQAGWLHHHGRLCRWHMRPTPTAAACTTT